MPLDLISDDDFRNAAKAGSVPADVKLRRGFVSEVKSVETDDRSLDFVISTDQVDRMGDTIAVDGWKLESFRKNPVVLWAHDSSILPVGKASNVRVEDGKLKARATFMPRELSGFADTVMKALKAGFLSASSVGFAPLKYNFVDDPQRRFGIDFLEQELLEFSIVPIPANPGALIEGRSADCDLAALIDYAEQTIERLAPPERKGSFAQKIAASQGNAILTRARLESVERAATAQRLASSRARRQRDIEILRLKAPQV